MFLTVEQTFYTLAVIGFTLFFIHHLDTKTYFKKAHKTLKTSLYILLIIFVIHEFNILISDKYPFFTQYIWLFIIACIFVYIFIINLKAVFRKIRLAYYILIAVGISIAGGVYSILTVAEVLTFSSQSQAKQILLLTQILWYHSGFFHSGFFMVRSQIVIM